MTATCQSSTSLQTHAFKDLSMYQATFGDAIKRLRDSAFIHPAPGNRDWQEFLFWSAAGNQLAPAERIPIDEIYATKVEEINRACEEVITAGFKSAALGALHLYSSQLDDQLNLTGAILHGLDMPYACRDEQDVRAFRLHTAKQLRQVGDDFTLYKLQLLQRANELKQQLGQALSAGDAQAMQAITWEGAES